MILLGFLIALLAWACLSLGLPRHQPAMLGRALDQRSSRTLRATGWLLLALDLALLVATRGWEMGPILWTCALILSAIAWVLAMTWRAARGA